jgi:L-threonylcarbamoyladenylate synthase
VTVGDASAEAVRDDAVNAAVQRLAGDALVAFPTETVWGLAARAASEPALARLARWKGRAEAQPIAVLVPDLDAVSALGAELSETARRLAAAFWPGPLTLVLRCPVRFAPGIAGPDGAVGFRSSPHAAARALARAAFASGIGPLTATSLNRSGVAPARTRAEAAALCGAGPDEPALLAGTWPEAGGAAPSTVVDATGREPRILREGAIAPALVARAAQGAP